MIPWIYPIDQRKKIIFSSNKSKRRTKMFLQLVIRFSIEMQSILSIIKRISSEKTCCHWLTNNKCLWLPMEKHDPIVKFKFIFYFYSDRGYLPKNNWISDFLIILISSVTEKGFSLCVNWNAFDNPLERIWVTHLKRIFTSSSSSFYLDHCNWFTPIS